MGTEGYDHRGYGDRRDDIGEYDVIVPKGRTRRKKERRSDLRIEPGIYPKIRK